MKQFILILQRKSAEGKLGHAVGEAIEDSRAGKAE
jgi:hypothetical protein